MAVGCRGLVSILGETLHVASSEKIDGGINDGGA